jgi:hypothetical protein
MASSRLVLPTPLLPTKQFILGENEISASPMFLKFNNETVFRYIKVNYAVNLTNSLALCV